MSVFHVIYKFNSLCLRRQSRQETHHVSVGVGGASGHEGLRQHQHHQEHDDERCHQVPVHFEAVTLQCPVGNIGVCECWLGGNTLTLPLSTLIKRRNTES